jgi:hypothetical protein
MYDSTTPLASRSARSVAVDNLMRRALRVSDPSDPVQVAEGLLSRYPEAADQIERERLGLNRRSVAEPDGIAFGGPSAAGTEVALARDNLERDLQTLTEASELKAIAVELRGWGRAVRKAAAEGLAAAPLALDVAHNDRAMSARRTLEEYARIVRYVGALSGDGGTRFRRLAQSLDAVAALILVGVGEGLAAAGVTRGTSMIRVSTSDLQTRRDSVIGAIRALKGGGHAPRYPESYPYGIVGLRQLTEALPTDPHLRALLDETAMADALDHLVDLAAGSSLAGLRELRTTAAVTVGRLSQLVAMCRKLEPRDEVQRFGIENPPISYFAEALELFIDAFRSESGTRLISVTRPTLLSYGLYGSTADPLVPVLGEIVMRRGRVAELADCIAGCACEPKAVVVQIVLDFLLERIDRAIDVIAAGSEGGADRVGPPEIAAAAFVRLWQAARDGDRQFVEDAGNPHLEATWLRGHPVGRRAGKRQQRSIIEELLAELDGVAEALNAILEGFDDDDLDPFVEEELLAVRDAEVRLQKLAVALAPGCLPPSLSPVVGFIDEALGHDDHDDGDGTPIIRHGPPAPIAASFDREVSILRKAMPLGPEAGTARRPVAGGQAKDDPRRRDERWEPAGAERVEGWSAVSAGEEEDENDAVRDDADLSDEVRGTDVHDDAAGDVEGHDLGSGDEDGDGNGNGDGDGDDDADGAAPSGAKSTPGGHKRANPNRGGRQRRK